MALCLCDVSESCNGVCSKKANREAQMFVCFGILFGTALRPKALCELFPSGCSMAIMEALGDLQLQNCGEAGILTNA